MGLGGLLLRRLKDQGFLPNVSYSRRLRFAKTKMLTDKNPIKFAAKIKAPPTCSSLLCPVPVSPAPAQPLLCTVQRLPKTGFHLSFRLDIPPVVLSAGFVVEMVVCG